MQVLEDAYTFDDVLLVPAYSTVLPKDVQLSTRLTRRISVNIPLVAAAMDTVTEASLAIALAQEGGIGIIHKNMSIESQAAHVHKVKKYESGIVKDPITVTANHTVGELLSLVRQHSFSGMPVVEGEQLLGIVTRRDWRFETDMDKRVADIMTPKERLVTVAEDATRDQINALFRKHRLEKILVVNEAFALRGMVTVKDIDKANVKPMACKDESGQLRVGAAVGTGADTEERVAALISAGVDVIAIDTAHGHSQGVLDRIRWIKKTFPDVDIIGGNIATAEGAKALVDAGVDAVKVGIGPGSICTTRVVTGVGVPQVTAIANVAKALKRSDVGIIADGGIRYSGDLCKAIAAGAHAVMVGSMFAGTDEAPGEVILYQGRSYKSYRGMGSLGAMAKKEGSSDRYFQDSESDAEKLVPEGIEGRVPYKGSMLNVVHQMMGGLRSSMGYTGSKDIDTLRTSARFVKITPAAVREGHVHDVTITKEAPNYRSE